MAFIEAGRVLESTVYPVKGMQGVPLKELTVRSVSVVGDRTRAFAITDTKQTPNLLDTTKLPGLLRYAPTFVTPSDVRNSPIEVTTLKGKNVSVDSQELLDELSELCGRPLAMVRMGRGAYHSMPVSLLGMASGRAIEEMVGFSLDPRRFRENVLMETIEGRPFEEEEWVGKLVKFGDRPNSAVLAAVKLDGRCATVNMDPETGEQRPEVLRVIARERENHLGLYASVVREGTISKGDTIYVSSIE